MPCSDGLAQDREADEARLARGNEAINLLCAAGRSFVAGKPPPNEVLAWWKEHAERDEKIGAGWKC
jgi:hypothetical protein